MHYKNRPEFNYYFENAYNYYGNNFNKEEYYRDYSVISHKYYSNNL